jgi:hypothetical protein
MTLHGGILALGGWGWAGTGHHLGDGQEPVEYRGSAAGLARLHSEGVQLHHFLKSGQAP